MNTLRRLTDKTMKAISDVFTVEAACPKCGTGVRRTAQACPRCGLLTKHFERFAAAQLAGDQALDELAPLWSTCRARWDETAPHDLLLDQARRRGLLPELARRYRVVLEGGADAIAEKRLKQIAILLEHALRAEAHEAGSPASTRAIWAIGYLVAALLLAASAWVLVVATHGHR